MPDERKAFETSAKQQVSDLYDRIERVRSEMVDVEGSHVISFQTRLNETKETLGEVERQVDNLPSVEPEHFEALKMGVENSLRSISDDIDAVLADFLQSRAGFPEE